MLRCVALVRTDVLEEPSTALRSVRRLLVAASVVPSSPILVTLMKEALGSSKTSVLTRATWRNIKEDTILHSHRRENLKFYIENTTIRKLGLFPFLSDRGDTLLSPREAANLNHFLRGLTG
jgi:hypothetical protein